MFPVDGEPLRCNPTDTLRSGRLRPHFQDHDHREELECRITSKQKIEQEAHRQISNLQSRKYTNTIQVPKIRCK